MQITIHGPETSFAHRQEQGRVPNLQFSKVIHKTDRGKRVKLGKRIYLERATLPHCLHLGLLWPRWDFGGVSVRWLKLEAAAARVVGFAGAVAAFMVALLLLLLIAGGAAAINSNLVLRRQRQMT